MDAHDKHYYCCGDCSALYPTLSGLSKHKVQCTGQRLADHELYAYGSQHQEVLLACHASCEHLATCPLAAATPKCLNISGRQRSRHSGRLVVRRGHRVLPSHSASDSAGKNLSDAPCAKRLRTADVDSGGTIEVKQQLEDMGHSDELIVIGEGAQLKSPGVGQAATTVQEGEDNLGGTSTLHSKLMSEEELAITTRSSSSEERSQVFEESPGNTLAAVPMIEVSVESQSPTGRGMEGELTSCELPDYDPHANTVTVIIESATVDACQRDGNNRLSQIINQIEGSLEQAQSGHTAEEEEEQQKQQRQPNCCVLDPQSLVGDAPNEALTEEALTEAALTEAPAEAPAVQAKPAGRSLYDEMKKFRHLLPAKGSLGTVQTYVCDVCKWSTPHIGFFARHLKNHNGTKAGSQWDCEQCDFSCKSRADMKRHCDKHTKPFMCEFCSRTFARKKDLTRHLYIHSGEQPFKCPHCDYRCRQPKSLSEHTKKHTGELVSCPVEGCGFTSVYKWAVKSHHLSKHTATKRFQCPQCAYKTSDTNSMLRHKRLHAGEKNFKCPLCTYCAVAKHDIVRHMRTHTKEKLYFCDRCSYSTCHASGLRLHMMNHLGVKPWQCVICGYNSLTRSKVLRHVRQTHRVQRAADADRAVVNLGLKLDINIKEYKTPHEGSAGAGVADGCTVVYAVDEAGECDEVEYVVSAGDEGQVVLAMRGEGEGNLETGPYPGLQTSLEAGATVQIIQTGEQQPALQTHHGADCARTVRLVEMSAHDPARRDVVVLGVDEQSSGELVLGSVVEHHQREVEVAGAPGHHYEEVVTTAVATHHHHEEVVVTGGAANHQVAAPCVLAVDDDGMQWGTADGHPLMENGQIEMVDIITS